jgi:hypothetical protein
MLACDWDMIINNWVAHFPGASHDRCIHLAQFSPRPSIETDPPNGWLFGDSGYPCKRCAWLLTPLADPQTRQEKLYQRRLTSARQAQITTQENVENYQ